MQKAVNPPPYYLMLDDLRSIQEARNTGRVYNRDGHVAILPDQEWTLVRCYTEFKTVVKCRGLPVMVSFDHDLCPEHFRHHPSAVKNGADCMKWLYGYCQKHRLFFPEWFVHSTNQLASASMQGFMKAAEGSLKNKKL